MEIIKEMTFLKEGDDVFFVNNDNKNWRWVGHVEKIRKKDVQFIYFPLFTNDNGDLVKKHESNFSKKWCDKNDHWKIYRVNKKEKERLDKELILINL